MRATSSTSATPLATIRRESHAERSVTEALVREAFWNVYSPGASEHALLHFIRRSPKFVGALSLVAVSSDGAIVGQIACMRSRIIAESSGMEVLTIGPLCVHPKHQGKGIGSALINTALSRATRVGFRAAFLTGDPDFYQRFGFLSCRNFNVRTPEGAMPSALMGIELAPGALLIVKRTGGVYREAEAYSVDPGAVERFERKFPPREKVSGTPTQLRFLELAKEWAV